MRKVEATIRELLAAAQAEQKAKLDAGLFVTVFTVGDRMLLRTRSCSTPPTLVSYGSVGTAPSL